MQAKLAKDDKEAPDDAAPMHFPGLPPRAGAARTPARPVAQECRGPDPGFGSLQESERTAGKASKKHCYCENTSAPALASLVHSS